MSDSIPMLGLSIPRTQVVDDSVEKLNRFASYPDGWAYGEGHRFDAVVLDRARTILTLAKALELEVDVFPGRNQQIIVTIYRANESFDFAVFPRGIRVSKEDKNGDENELPFDVALIALIGGVGKWNSSAYFIPTNSSHVRTGSRVPHSNRMWTTGASQFLRNTVLKPLQDVRASM